MLHDNILELPKTLFTLSNSNAFEASLISGNIKMFDYDKNYSQGDKSENIVLKIIKQIRTDKKVDDGIEMLDVCPEIIMRGHYIRQSRNVGFYGPLHIPGYRYSGIIAKTKPMSNEMVEMVRRVSTHFGMNERNVGILINEYSGNAKIGEHSDDERDLVLGPGVISISCGASRTFRVKAKVDCEIKFYDSKGTNVSTKIIKRGEKVADVQTKNMQVLQMKGKDFQSFFTHQVPKFSTDSGTRWSLTFREYK